MSEAYSRQQFETMQEGVLRRRQDRYILADEATYYLGIEDRMVIVETVDAVDLVTIVLPSVAEARGCFVTIFCEKIAVDEAVRVIDQLDDELWPPLAYPLLTAAKDYVIFYSTGRHWLDVGCHCGSHEYSPE